MRKDGLLGNRDDLMMGCVDAFDDDDWLKAMHEGGSGPADPPKSSLEDLKQGVKKTIKIDEIDQKWKHIAKADKWDDGVKRMS